jgi:acyl carrier protein
MERSVIVKQVTQVLIKVLKHDNFKVHDELSARDVEGWDSLTHMEIITEIEAVFNIKFKLKDLNKLKNLGTLIELIESKLQ